MAAPTLVDRRIDHGALFLAALDAAAVPIDSAFWLFTSEWNEWRLVLATPLVDEYGPLEAYRRLQLVYYAHPEISFRFDSIAVVGSDDLRVQEMRSAFKTWPLRFSNRLEDRFIQSRGIEDSYVYRLLPPPSPTVAHGRHRKSTGAR